MYAARSWGGREYPNVVLKVVPPRCAIRGMSAGVARRVIISDGLGFISESAGRLAGVLSPIVAVGMNL